MDATELEKVFDLKLELVNGKLDTIETRIDALISTAKWVTGVIVFPLVSAVFLFFLGKVI